MKDKQPKILVVDDNHEICELLSYILSDEGLMVQTSGSGLKAIKMLEEENFDVILTDFRMGGMDGLDLLAAAKQKAPMTPVVIMTAFGTHEAGLKAIKMGAFDYVRKTDQMEGLVLAVMRALEHRLLRRELDCLRRRVEPDYPFHDLIGKCPALKKVHEAIETVCVASCNILITGETGTGKEWVAKAIHYHDRSERKKGPFIVANCGAIPVRLNEGDILGDKRVEYAVSRSDRSGLIAEADGGTLFLDEIAGIPPALQGKLLSVIEEGKVRPMGSKVAYPIDLRVISSSSRDIASIIEEGNFRNDLYCRLKMVAIELPPLRERKEDIPLLVQHFIDRFSKEVKKQVTGISGDALKALLDYSWPGNVRELENVIQRAVIFSQGETLLPIDFRAR